MIERPGLKQPRLKANWPAPSLRLPSAGTATSSLMQAALVVLGIALITFILYLYLLPHSRISEAQARINDLQRQHAALIRQHAEVLREISAYTDLGTLQQRAQKLGMGPARNVIFLPATSAKPTPSSNRDERKESSLP